MILYGSPVFFSIHRKIRRLEK